MVDVQYSACVLAASWWVVILTAKVLLSKIPNVKRLQQTVLPKN